MVILPTGQILTSTAGVIDYDYTGGAGRVTLIVPKNSTVVDFRDTDFYGDTLLINGSYNSVYFSDASLPASSNDVIKHVIADNVNTISGYSRGVQTVSAKSASIINFESSALTAESIYGILDDAYTLALSGEGSGTINVGGTGNAEINEDLVSVVHGVNYGALYELLTNGDTINWLVTVNWMEI